MKTLLTFFVLFFSSSVVAEGCISGDCTNGYGTYIYFNGNKYVGENKNDEAHGQGTYTYADGSVEKGIWKNGELVEMTPSIWQLLINFFS